ncbi:MAG TPA: YlbF family regulator [Anaerolineales bacterium]|nr:YlbF family regulator [Anaerolineales bacterium]
METTISPQLQEATQSLINNLLASEAFVRYQNARAQFNADKEAHDLMDQLSKSQARLRQKQSSGGVGQAEVDALRLLQQRVQRNPVIMAYAQAQEEAVNFLREINGEISQLLGINFATLANHATC